ncbi:hypothetical protein Tco_1484037 [Tanacetum coccineum]
MGNNVFTVGGDKVKVGLQLKLRFIWSKNKQRPQGWIILEEYGTAEEARNICRAKKVWGDRNQDEVGISWLRLVHSGTAWRDCIFFIVFQEPLCAECLPTSEEHDLTHQGKKSFAQGKETNMRGPQAFPNFISREESGSDIEAKKIKRPSLLRKHNQQEAPARAYLPAFEG